LEYDCFFLGWHIFRILLLVSRIVKGWGFTFLWGQIEFAVEFAEFTGMIEQLVSNFSISPGLVKMGCAGRHLPVNF